MTETQCPYCGAEMALKVREEPKSKWNARYVCNKCHSTGPYHEQTTDDYDWQDCECDTEYDEEKDCYWVKECWYEVNEVDDNPNWIIDSDYVVTHWMPLPEPPKED